MIAELRPETNESQLSSLINWLEGLGLQVQIYSEGNSTILGMIGDVTRVDMRLLESMHIVASVRRVSDSFKKANRKFHPHSTTIQVGNTRIGGDSFTVIAGPCSVESEKQIIAVAEAVRQCGADILRGGAFKPRTSPYAFQGLGVEGIDLLLKAKRATGLPIITEIMNISTLNLFNDVDIIQVGARNMQNFDLLKELGRSNKPILLKRGPGNTIQELLMSAEYMMCEGNENIILCERGIRTFETYTRNTLDLSAVPVLQQLSHLPVIVDPSHGTGKAQLVAPMAMASAASVADGVMIEVHNNPSCALCDGPQSLTPDQFAALNTKMRQINKIARSYP